MRQNSSPQTNGRRFTMTDHIGASFLCFPSSQWTSERALLDTNGAAFLTRRVCGTAADCDEDYLRCC